MTACRQALALDSPGGPAGDDGTGHPLGGSEIGARARQVGNRDRDETRELGETELSA
jgi:hypothetical protein